MTMKSIGVETLGGVFTPLLSLEEGQDTSPSNIFTTSSDNQKSISVHLYKGSAELVADCTYLGEFKVMGINPAPRGLPKIEITFSLTEGRLVVTAKDLNSNEPLEVKKKKRSK